MEKTITWFSSSITPIITLTMKKVSAISVKISDVFIHDLYIFAVTSKRPLKFVHSREELKFIKEMIGRIIVLIKIWNKDV